MRTLEQWIAVIEDMKASGIPQKQWCAAQSINWGTLHAAQIRINHVKRAHENNHPKFVQVQTPPATPAVTITCKGITITTTAQDAAAIIVHPAASILTRWEQRSTEPRSTLRFLKERHSTDAGTLRKRPSKALPQRFSSRRFRCSTHAYSVR